MAFCPVEKSPVVRVPPYFLHLFFSPKSRRRIWPAYDFISNVPLKLLNLFHDSNALKANSVVSLKRGDSNFSHLIYKAPLFCSGNTRISKRPIVYLDFNRAHFNILQRIYYIRTVSPWFKYTSLLINSTNMHHCIGLFTNHTLTHVLFCQNIAFHLFPYSPQNAKDIFTP